jgi:hypothetical protein
MPCAIERMPQSPAGWPRLAPLATLVLAYGGFPRLLRQRLGRQQEHETIERLRRFVQGKT